MGWADLFAYVFDYRELIGTTEETYDAYDSDGHELGEQRAGCMLDKRWTEPCVTDSIRLGRICEALAKSNEYSSHHLGQLGNFPAAVLRSDIQHGFQTERKAQDAAAEAKRTVISQLGYITWFLACREDWGRGLAIAEKVYITSLCLWDHPRRGVLVDVERYWNEMNIPLWIKEKIPVHYPWTSNLDLIKRFFILSPTFLSEYFSAVEANEGVEVPIESLQMYPLWGPRLARYNLYLRRAQLGRLARTFRPGHVYKIVDKLYWGGGTYPPGKWQAPTQRNSCAPSWSTKM
jgi:hypothetical protein